MVWLSYLYLKKLVANITLCDAIVVFVYSPSYTAKYVWFIANSVPSDVNEIMFSLFFSVWFMVRPEGYCLERRLNKIDKLLCPKTLEWLQL